MLKKVSKLYIKKLVTFEGQISNTSIIWIIQFLICFCYILYLYVHTDYLEGIIILLIVFNQFWVEDQWKRPSPSADISTEVFTVELPSEQKKVPPNTNQSIILRLYFFLTWKLKTPGTRLVCQYLRSKQLPCCFISLKWKLVRS